MREFILRAQRSRTSDIDLDDLPGAGRFDIICDCVANALHVSKNIRRDVVFHVVLEGPKFPPKTISFYGKDMHELNFDEQSVAKVLIKCLAKGKNLQLGDKTEVFPGIVVSKKSFESLIKERAENKKKMFYLHKKGKDLRKIGFKKDDDVVFVFGDFTGIPKNTEKFLDRNNAEKISLGPIMLFASHCIPICLNELDRLQE
jgi:tRNA (pseudouridine54-N1)-methyltransferase